MGINRPSRLRDGKSTYMRVRADFPGNALHAA
jgi:hypothetical protein